jgi:hypothetical protein
MLLATRVSCQTSGEEAARLIEQPPKTQLNQVRVSARLGYNISARLENVGVPAGQSFPQPPPPKDPTRHFVSATGVGYADGYVGIDESGNLPGPGETDPRSIYWGYANANQVVGGNLLLTHSSSGTLFGNFKNDPQAGVEISYSRQLGVRDTTTFGFEAGFTYTSLDLRSHGIVDPSVLSVDAFPLGGVVPPAAPYAGTYEPGPFGSPAIVATPTRYPVNIDSSFDASIYGLKVGPYFEFPLAKRLAFALSGGFALLLSDTEFHIQQSAAVASPSISSGSIKSSEIAVLPGAYVGGRLSLTMSDSVNVFTGLEYESTGHHSQELGGKRLNIDFWNQIYWTFGVSYSF